MTKKVPISGSLTAPGPRGMPTVVRFDGHWWQIKLNEHSTQDEFEFKVDVSWSLPEDLTGLVTLSQDERDRADDAVRSVIEAELRNGFARQFGGT